MAAKSDKWNERYFKLAKEVAAWSKDPSRKIGAVIVGHKGQIISQGYNGFPRGIMDHPHRYEDKETKYKYVVHAEMNAIYNAIYNGASTEGATLYVTGLPVCNECAKAVIQVGIKKVVYDTEASSHWSDSTELGIEMMLEAGVEIEYKPST
ncbi:MAG: hypothetical protein RL113_1292 [Pseudomonadota bacterium]|jgi:dCMP deaminase